MPPGSSERMDHQSAEFRQALESVFSDETAMFRTPPEPDQGDSVTLWLPRPAILDNNFIDEARTKSFHESGRWTARDRETLYRRAQQRMLRYSLTPQNIETARKNGDAQMRRLMLSMGYQHVNIQWK